MKSKIFRTTAVTLLFACILSIGIPCAFANGGEVQPCYTGVVQMAPALRISSLGNASCTDRVILRSGYSANVTWTLQFRRNNQSWNTKMTWSGSGTSLISLNQNYFVVSGYDYRLKTSVQVYTSGGSWVENTVAYSPIASF